MVQQLEILAEEGVPKEPKIRALKGGYMMYYRQPNGHVAPASAQKMDVSNFIESEWRPLPRYGHHMADHVNIHRPLDDLFRKGGAKELPISQLIEERFAYPVWGPTGDRFYEVDGVTVEFPQLRGATIPPLETCPYCSHQAIHQGIEGHLEVQHQKDVGSVKLAEIIAKAMKGEDPTIKAVQEIVEKVTTHPYICGKCGEGFNGHMQLAKHVKEHRNDS